MEEVDDSSSCEDEPVEYLDGTKDTSYMDIEALETLINGDSESEYSDCNDEQNENDQNVLLEEEYNNYVKTPEQSQALSISCLNIINLLDDLLNEIKEKYSDITTPKGTSTHSNTKQKQKMPDLKLENGEDEDEYNDNKSDDDEEGKKLYGKVGEGEEQFYDENEDEENEVWVKKHCRII